MTSANRLGCPQCGEARTLEQQEATIKELKAELRRIEDARKRREEEAHRKKAASKLPNKPRVLKKGGIPICNTGSGPYSVSTILNASITDFVIQAPIGGAINLQASNGTTRMSINDDGIDFADVGLNTNQETCLRCGLLYDPLAAERAKAHAAEIEALRVKISPLHALACAAEHDPLVESVTS